jgi:ABC-type glycerol-3-phosphate transport system permease component
MQAPSNAATLREGYRLSPRALVVYPAAVIMALVVLAPIVFMILVAFQPRSVAGTLTLPAQLNAQSFIDVWRTVALANYLKNSILVSLTTAIASGILGFGAAYVIARFRFRMRQLFKLSLLACYIMPGIVLLIPLYLIYIRIQDALGITLVGTPPILILTYMTFSLPYTIWLLTGYLASLPVEIEEAAGIDGATRLQTLRLVIFPLALPGLVVTGIFSFLLAWNDVLFASVLTTTDSRTVGMGLEVFIATAESGPPQWNNLMAAGLIAALPAVLLFLFIQRYLIGGLTAGAVK